MVKCGLHSPTYYLHPHLGGPHPVLYFTIQATEKYSNSNVLRCGLLGQKYVQSTWETKMLQDKYLCTNIWSGAGR